MLRHPLRLALCGLALVVGCASACAETDEPAHSAELDAAIIKQAQRNGVPEALVRRIVMRESRYNPRARNHSFWGLMQISYPTAKSMGFKGTPQDLLNPIVNLRYAVPYLANAFIIAGKREDTAVRLYASGYYSTAKQRGLLSLLRTAETAPVSGAPDEPILTAAAAAPQSDSVFGSLFGAAPALQPSVQTASDGTAVPAAASVALPQGKNAADAGIDMSADRSGALHLPKKWLHDGGSTQVARGEQGVEQVAAFDQRERRQDRHGARPCLAQEDQFRRSRSASRQCAGLCGNGGGTGSPPGKHRFASRHPAGHIASTRPAGRSGDKRRSDLSTRRSPGCSGRQAVAETQHGAEASRQGCQ